MWSKAVEQHLNDSKAEVQWQTKDDGVAHAHDEGRAAEHRNEPARLDHRRREDAGVPAEHEPAERHVRRDVPDAARGLAGGRQRGREHGALRRKNRTGVRFVFDGVEQLMTRERAEGADRLLCMWCCALVCYVPCLVGALVVLTHILD